MAQGFALGNIVQHLVILRLGGERTHGGFGIKRVAVFQIFGHCHDALKNARGHGFLNDKARSGRTHLARIVEDAADDEFGCKLFISIGKDDDGGLATELEANGFRSGGGRLHHAGPHAIAAGK